MSQPVERFAPQRSRDREVVLEPTSHPPTGIQKMQKALENQQGTELILAETGHAFQVQFKKKSMVLDLADKAAVTETVQVSYKMRPSTVQDEYKLKLLDFCREQRSIKEMMTYMNLKHWASFLISYIHPLLQGQLISMAIPDKPKSPRQKYVITERGQKELKK